jgi:SAM-dependent methyltransferase
MALTNRDLRQRAFGQDLEPTVVDRFGTFLSARQIRRTVGTFAGKRVADIGCGYHARLAASLLASVDRMLLVDVALAPTLKADPRVIAIEGFVPEALNVIPSSSLDVLICNSVLEHLWDPLETLREFWRLLAPGGIALVNVPSWRGKWFLELSAFRLGFSPAEEMDDHKRYYDPKDLWPLLVEAGFRPRDVRCFRHKFGLNTFAQCRKGTAPTPPRLP